MKGLHQQFKRWMLQDRGGPRLTVPCFSELHEPFEDQLLEIPKEKRLKWCIDKVKSITGDQLREVAADELSKTAIQRNLRVLQTLSFTKLLPRDLERRWLKFFPSGNESEYSSDQVCIVLPSIPTYLVSGDVRFPSASDRTGTLAPRVCTCCVGVVGWVRG